MPRLTSLSSSSCQAGVDVKCSPSGGDIQLERRQRFDRDAAIRLEIVLQA